jgi:hypothetical protein
MLNTMESEPFDRDMLESCRLDNERELKNVSTLPSREEIDVLKRQIRAENEARQGLKAVRRISPAEGRQDQQRRPHNAAALRTFPPVAPALR